MAIKFEEYRYLYGLHDNMRYYIENLLNYVRIHFSGDSTIDELGLIHRTDNHEIIDMTRSYMYGTDGWFERLGRLPAITQNMSQEDYQNTLNALNELRQHINEHVERTVNSNRPEDVEAFLIPGNDFFERDTIAVVGSRQNLQYLIGNDGKEYNNDHINQNAQDSGNDNNHSDFTLPDIDDDFTPPDNTRESFFSPEQIAEGIREEQNAAVPFEEISRQSTFRNNLTEYIKDIRIYISSKNDKDRLSLFNTIHQFNTELSTIPLASFFEDMSREEYDAIWQQLNDFRSKLDNFVTENLNDNLPEGIEPFYIPGDEFYTRSPFSFDIEIPPEDILNGLGIMQKEQKGKNLNEIPDNNDSPEIFQPIRVEDLERVDGRLSELKKINSYLSDVIIPRLKKYAEKFSLDDNEDAEGRFTPIDHLTSIDNLFKYNIRAIDKSGANTNIQTIHQDTIENIQHLKWFISNHSNEMQRAYNEDNAYYTESPETLSSVVNLYQERIEPENNAGGNDSFDVQPESPVGGGENPYEPENNSNGNDDVDADPDTNDKADAEPNTNEDREHLPDDMEPLPDDENEQPDDSQHDNAVNNSLNDEFERPELPTGSDAYLADIERRGEQRPQRPQQPDMTLESENPPQQPDITLDGGSGQPGRVRSPNGQANLETLTKIQLKVFCNMGLATHTDADINAMDLKTVMDKVGAVKLNRAQQLDFNRRYLNALEQTAAFENLPPRALIDAYSRIGKGSQAPQNREFVLGRMKELFDQMGSIGEDFYNFADYTNKGDTVKGYQEMLDFMDAHKNEFKGANSYTAADMKNVRSLLDTYMKDWDSRHNLGWDEKSMSKSALDKTAQTIGTRTDKLNNFHRSFTVADLTDDNKDLFSNIQFENTGGDPPDAAKLKKMLIDMAKNEAMQNLIGADRTSSNVSANDYYREVNDNSFGEVLYRTYIADQVSRGAMERPDQFTDPKYMQEFLEKLKLEQIKLREDTVYEAANVHVNDTLNYMERVGDKLGHTDGENTKRNDAIHNTQEKIYNTIKDIDTVGAERRFSSVTAQAIRGNFAKSLATTALTTAGTAFAFGVMRRINWPVPGIGMAAAGLVSSGLAIINIKKQYDRWKVAQKQNGAPCTFKDWFKLPETKIALGASVASVVGAITGIGAETGTALNAVSMGARGLGLLGHTATAVISSVKSTAAAVKEAKKNGKSTVWEVLKGIGKGAAGLGVPILAAIGGAKAAEGLVNGITSGNLPGNPDLFKTNKPESKVWVEGEKTYKEVYTYEDDVVDKARATFTSGNMEERNAGPYMPGEDFEEPHSGSEYVRNLEKAQNPGGYTTHDWQNNEGFKNIFENIKRDMVDGNHAGIRDWDGEGVAEVMARKIMSFDRLDNLGENHAVELPNGNVVDVRVLAANLAKAGGYVMTEDERLAVDMIQDNVSWKGEYIPEVAGLSDTDTWKNPKLINNSYNAAGDPRISVIQTEIGGGYWKTIPGEEYKFDSLPIVLPFVAPIAGTVKNLKKGIKALLDKIKQGDKSYPETESVLENNEAFNVNIISSGNSGR